MIEARLDAVLFDLGGTLVREADGSLPIADLRAELLPRVLADVQELSATVRIGVVTNTSVMTEADVRALLRPTGLDALVEVLVTSCDVGVAKPDPAPIIEALRRLGTTPDRAVYVGDLDTDRQAAEAAGVAFAPILDDGAAASVDAWLRRQAGGRLRDAVAQVVPPDAAAGAAAAEHQDRLTKPPGSLGRLEQLSVQLSSLAGTCPPPVPEPAVVTVFAGDHGVLDQGISPWPQDVTAMMVAGFAKGGAAVNVLARQAGCEVVVVDVGVASALEDLPGLLHRKVRPATADLALGPAMSLTEALLALDVGVEVADHLVADGARCLITGEMGIGNTTPSAALIAALADADPVAVTGRGTGIDDERLARKAEIVAGAAARAAGLAPAAALAEAGGLEIAALAGYVIGGARAQVPVLVDGVIALAALLVAEQLCPGVSAWCIAGHRSTEPGATVVLEHLGLDPVLDLDLRLGEGTGAVLALPIVQASARILHEMATFEDA